MSADLVNLRQARKQRERMKKRSQGTENASKHGRSIAERRLENAREEKARGDFEAHRRVTDSDGD